MFMSVPRKRGDGPEDATMAEEKKECSPQARGWTDPILRIPSGQAVFPASAGMDRPW